MLSGPLFQKTQGEDNGEEKSEADMSEERNAEGGEIKIYVRDKNNCTTLETSLVISITYVSPNIVMSSLPTNIIILQPFIRTQLTPCYSITWFRQKNENPSYLNSDEKHLK